MSSSLDAHSPVIEYIQDRLYLASYDNPPCASTPLQYPSEQTKSPNKKASRKENAASKSNGVQKPAAPLYFTVDDILLYNAFHADFGPLHIGHLYRFAVHFHEILGDPANAERPVVLWTRPDSKSRANTACLVACYMVLIQSWPPHLALAPIAQVEPPYMPFRDAGYSQADFILSIQDVVYGVWKAKEVGLCSLKDFNLEEYERFERVDMGDFNWITPNFLAFASPQHEPVAATAQDVSEFAPLPSTIADVEVSKLPTPFKNVLSHFSSRNIGLVVRLNSELYCSSYFTALGINHLDMIFEDGTCPPLPLARRFIKLAHEMITSKNKAIAVHCKAGLGRTGCLIGAYLIYRYGFTANEVIAFMRFMRPGMVVGPQQHWLHLNQGNFREWWFEDTMKPKFSLSSPTTPARPMQRQRITSNGQTATPPNGSQSQRHALGEIDHNEASPGYADDNLPAPTPGQPRKSHRKDSKYKPYARAVSGDVLRENLEETGQQNINNGGYHQTTDYSESDEELHCQMVAQRTPMSRSAATSSLQRSISHSATMAPISIHEDVENWEENALNSKSKASAGKAGSGVLGVTKVRTSPRRATESKTESKGVRKVSGRVGSAGASARVR